MADTKKIWLTRPIDDSENFARELAEKGIATIIAPVKRITHQPFTKPIDAPDAMLLTSRHAAYALADFPASWHNVPVYCVGQATATYVTEFGYKRIYPGTSDVLALLPRMAGEIGPQKRLLYLAGEDRRVDVATLMRPREIEVDTIIVYRAAPERNLNPALLEALQRDEVGSVAFFSPRSAETAIQLLQQSGFAEKAPGITAFCLSLNVAKSAGGLPWRALHASHLPTRRAMLELIVSKITQS